MDTVARSAARLCARCQAPIESANEGTICFECAKTIYLEIRRAGGLLRHASVHEWLSTVGFAPGADWWSHTGTTEEGLPAELYGVSWAAAGHLYSEGNLSSSNGLIALIRLHCPSGMMYQAALPVGPRHGREERLTGPLAPTSRKHWNELTEARKFANELALSHGGPPPTPWEDNVVTLVEAIRATTPPGELRSVSARRANQIRRAVAILLYPQADDPGNSLRDLLKRIRDHRDSPFASWQEVWTAALDEAGPRT